LCVPGAKDGPLHECMKLPRRSELKRWLWLYGDGRFNGGGMGIANSSEAWAFTAV
jgi:hypothetical protein